MKKYLPLIVIISVSILAGLSISWTKFNLLNVMHSSMGVFLLFFASLKLFDLNGFANGFQKYDLLAKRSRLYAMCYPFLELALSLGYLSGGGFMVYLATLFLMGFGALGVLSALKQGLDTRCACLGTALSVPLSTVAVVENVGMVLMATLMIII